MCRSVLLLLAVAIVAGVVVTTCAAHRNWLAYKCILRRCVCSLIATSVCGLLLCDDHGAATTHHLVLLHLLHVHHSASLACSSRHNHHQHAEGAQRNPQHPNAELSPGVAAARAVVEVVPIWAVVVVVGIAAESH